MPAIAGLSGYHITVSSGDQRCPEELVFRASRKPVVLGERYAAFAFANQYVRERGGQVVLLGTESGN